MLCVLQTKPLLLPVDIQHNQCMRRLFYARDAQVCGHKTTPQNYYIDMYYPMPLGRIPTLLVLENELGRGPALLFYCSDRQTKAHRGPYTTALGVVESQPCCATVQTAKLRHTEGGKRPRGIIG